MNPTRVFFFCLFLLIVGCSSGDDSDSISFGSTKITRGLYRMDMTSESETCDPARALSDDRTIRVSHAPGVVNVLIVVGDNREEIEFMVGNEDPTVRQGRDFVCRDCTYDVQRIFEIMAVGDDRFDLLETVNWRLVGADCPCQIMQPYRGYSLHPKERCTTVTRHSYSLLEPCSQFCEVQGESGIDDICC